MTQFPTNPDSNAPRIDVAEGVIRFKPDLSEVNAELDALERRLDAIEDRAKGVGGSFGDTRERDQPAAPGFVAPLLPSEQIDAKQDEMLAILSGIYDLLAQQTQAGV